LIDASVLLFVGRVQPPVPLLCSESLIAFVFRQNGEEGKLSVYVHSAPGFQLDRTTTLSPYFYGRQLARSIKVAPPLIIFYDAEIFFFSRGAAACSSGFRPLRVGEIRLCPVQVGWGEATMVEAERMLFAAALQDPANQRFVLLSDRCGTFPNATCMPFA
jgi:hypothetical protein